MDFTLTSPVKLLYFSAAFCLRKVFLMTNHINAHTHLTLEERRIIANGIYNGATKAAISQTIGKDPSTIGKEIKRHLQGRTYRHNLYFFF